LALREILELGRWAHGALQVAACLEPNPIIASKWSAGVHAVLHQQQALSYVMLGNTPEPWARALSKMRRWSTWGVNVPVSKPGLELEQTISGVRPRATPGQK